MELWQMDVVGRIHLADRTELAGSTGQVTDVEDQPVSAAGLSVVVRRA